jgi:hypothetical protein
VKAAVSVVLAGWTVTVLAVAPEEVADPPGMEADVGAGSVVTVVGAVVPACGELVDVLLLEDVAGALISIPADAAMRVSRSAWSVCRARNGAVHAAGS